MKVKRLYDSFQFPHVDNSQVYGNRSLAFNHQLCLLILTSTRHKCCTANIHVY